MGQIRQDRAGLEAFVPEVALDCLWIGEDEAATYLAPWAILQWAVRAVYVSRAARLEMLEGVYATLEARFSTLRKVRLGKAVGIAERAGSGVPLTFTTRQQLKRGLNLVIGLYYAIETSRWRSIASARTAVRPGSARSEAFYQDTIRFGSGRVLRCPRT
jgi:hypothetical protein